MNGQKTSQILLVLQTVYITGIDSNSRKGENFM